MTNRLVDNFYFTLICTTWSLFLPILHRLLLVIFPNVQKRAGITNSGFFTVVPGHKDMLNILPHLLVSTNLIQRCIMMFIIILNLTAVDST